MTRQDCQEPAQTCAPSRQLLMGFCHLTLQQVDTANLRQEDRSEFTWPLITVPLKRRLLQNRFRFPFRITGFVSPGVELGLPSYGFSVSRLGIRTEIFYGIPGKCWGRTIGGHERFLPQPYHIIIHNLPSIQLDAKYTKTRTSSRTEVIMPSFQF
jgi:hypothetical protein